MAGRTVTIELPDDLYDRLRRRAIETQRGIAAEVVALLRASAPPDGAVLPPEIEAELARLETLDDAALWKTARRHVSVRKARRLESLNFKKQRGGLNAVERRIAGRLLEELDRHMLVRAHALRLLKNRGYDVNELVSGE